MVSQPSDRTPPEGHAQRRRRIISTVEELAREQSGVVSRGQAADLGAGWDRIRTETAARRWKAHGRHTVAVHCGELDERARWWVALFEVGSGAALDGSTALAAAGLKGYEDQLQVSVPHGSDPRRPPGITVRELIAWRQSDLVTAGIPRVRPVVAAVRAAAWAWTDRQAALVLLMTSQQRFARPIDMLEYAQSRVRLSRRAVIESVLKDAASGVQALGELDFARLCRKRGLPEPSRQVVRQRPSGRAYLDVEWEDYGVVVEIDGVQHLEPLHTLDDALRQNDVTLGNRAVLRIPNLGLILEEDRFMDQVALLLRSRTPRRRSA